MGEKGRGGFWKTSKFKCLGKENEGLRKKNKQNKFSNNCRKQQQQKACMKKVASYFGGHFSTSVHGQQQPLHCGSLDRRRFAPCAV